MVDFLLVCRPRCRSDYPDLLASFEVVPGHDGPIRDGIWRRGMLIVGADVSRRVCTETDSRSYGLVRYHPCYTSDGYSRSDAFYLQLLPIIHHAGNLRRILY